MLRVRKSFESEEVGWWLSPPYHVWEEGLGFRVPFGAPHKPEELRDVDDVTLRQAQFPLQHLTVPVDTALVGSPRGCIRGGDSVEQQQGSVVRTGVQAPRDLTLLPSARA